MSAIQKTVLSSHRGLARASYWPRVFGQALGLAMLGSVLYERDVPLWYWLVPSLYAFGWPHLGRWLSQRAEDGMAAERRNLLIDHFAGGLWTAAIAFNLLPSVLLVSLMSMDSIIGGGARQLRRGLAVHAAGIGLGLLLFGAHWQPMPSMLTVLTCLPLLLLHPISIGLATHRALSKLSLQREELFRLSQRDGLSGLYNRRHWEQQVGAEFARFVRTGQVATLVLIDLDHFKRINDQHGHDAGDTAIKRFADLLRASLRDIDVPGRYGGEEFGILLPQTTPQSAAVVMERLRKRLHQEPLLEGVVITASFGVAGASRELESHAAWMRVADQMLYRAKHQGRDQISVVGEPLASPRPAPTAHQMSVAAQLLRDAQIRSPLLSGIDNGTSAIALFDPVDRLALANAAFLTLHAAPPDARSFADLMRHCHARRCGPRVDTNDIEEWLHMADAQRRSQPYRSFDISLCDGRKFRVDETSFDHGWLLFVAEPVIRGVDDAVPAAGQTPAPQYART